MWDFFLSQLWSFIGALVGVTGTVLACWFYIRSRKRKRLSFQVRRHTIFGDRIASLDGLEIFYQGAAVPKLFDYRVLIWNSGNEIIHPTDFASLEPLRILLPGETESVVGVNLFGSSSEANLARLVFDNPEEILVEFEYLAAKEGIVTSLLCREELTTGPVVEGLIKGARKLQHFDPSPRRITIHIAFIPLLAFCICLLGFCSGILSSSRVLVYGGLSLLILGGPMYQLYYAWRFLIPAKRDRGIVELFDLGFHQPDR